VSRRFDIAPRNRSTIGRAAGLRAGSLLLRASARAEPGRAVRLERLGRDRLGGVEEIEMITARRTGGAYEPGGSRRNRSIRSSNVSAESCGNLADIVADIDTSARNPNPHSRQMLTPRRGRACRNFAIGASSEEEWGSFRLSGSCAGREVKVFLQAAIGRGVFRCQDHQVRPWQPLSGKPCLLGGGHQREFGHQ
jgi:hypothetical protein